MNPNRTTGYLYAFGASLALAASFIFSKSVLNHLSMIHFGLLWFSFGVLWNGIWFLSRSEYRKLKDSFWSKTVVALIIALLEGSATGLFYLAIKAMENPAVVSFIGNIGPVFVTLMGITLLRERFSSIQVTGILVTIIGVFVINYREGGFTGFVDPGSVYVISASFLFATATISGRKFHKLLVPGYMSLIRSSLLAITMAVLFFTKKATGVFEIPIHIWRDIGAGSLFETMIVIVFAYQALKLIEATKTSLIISTKGVWTLALAWIFLGVFPTGFQLTGGILTLVGVWLITWDRSRSHQG